MAYIPTEWECGDTITAEKLNKLEQAVANSGGGDVVTAVDIKSESETDVNSFSSLQIASSQGGAAMVQTAVFADIDDISKVHYIVYDGVMRNVEAAVLSKETIFAPQGSLNVGNHLIEDTEAWYVRLSKSPISSGPTPTPYEDVFIFPTSTKVDVVFS